MIHQYVIFYVKSEVNKIVHEESSDTFNSKFIDLLILWYKEGEKTE